MASEQSADKQERWECPECREQHAGIGAKVPGGCLNCVDLIRYIEYEAPGIAMVENDVARVVCFNDDCKQTVDVDPHTMYVRDEDACSIESETYDMEAGEKTGHSRVEIYCSPECRNDQYNTPVPGDVEVPR